jgi:cell division protein FtsB
MGFSANIRTFAPIGLIGLAIAVTFLSLFGDDSFYRLSALRESALQQEKINQMNRENIDDLKDSVDSLRNGGRALEKAARNELGLARPNEQIFIFDSKD